jgi:hypothetical protein
MPPAKQGDGPLDDPAFEMRLGRLFSEAPQYPDCLLFADRIESRLGRGWALRRVFIASAGIVGGLIAAGQMIGSGLVSRIDGASHMVSAAQQGFGHLPAPLLPQLSILNDMPFGGEVVWLVLGLAVLAGALFAGRSLEQI